MGAWFEQGYSYVAYNHECDRSCVVILFYHNILIEYKRQEITEEKEALLFPVLFYLCSSFIYSLLPCNPSHCGI